MAGMRFVPKGENDFVFAPTLWERDERKGPGWKQVRTAPMPLSYDVRFNDVDASSPRNAVLGGDYTDQAGGVVTQLWNGKAWKSAVALVPRGTINGGILSVGTRAPGDAWGVGWAQVGPRQDGMIWHWDGTRWKAQKLPDIGEGDKGGWGLDGVAVLADDDVWAVGSTGFPEPEKPVLLHYDGKSWSKVAVPGVGAARAGLKTVAAGPDGQVWAVGKSQAPDGSSRALALRYDGKKWTNVPLPKGTRGLASVTISQGDPVVLVAKTKHAGSTVLRRTGGKWVPMNLPGGAERFGGDDITASGRTIDIPGNHPAKGSQWVGPGSVLTARR
ncbi:hypothetical protein CD790_01570 [Streptomyces sp. SAJ15]|nr:hypothetical protein CD790_01570 [Streptomyces sp. SAJ15]